MLKNARLIALLAVAGLAGTAMAQDSVGQRTGLANTDALRPHETTEQCNAFVNDLTAITSSLNMTWGVTPLAKMSRSSTSFTNNLMSSDAISGTSHAVKGSAAGSYLFWDTAGPGINQSLVGAPPMSANSAAAPVAGPGGSFQLGYAFTDFGTQSTNLSFNGVVSGFVNVDANNPTRLYVTRQQTAVNGNFGENRSQFGLGSIDSSGNVHIRADRGGAADQATTPPFLTGVNLFRFDSTARTCAAVNIVDNNGGSDPGTTVRLLTNSTVAHPVPNIIPEATAGRPILMDGNFNRQYVYESAAGVLSNVTTHRPGTDDHRGSVGYTATNFFLPSVTGTGAVLSKPTPAGGKTIGISVWGLMADGGVGGTRLLELPASLTDQCSGFTWNRTSPDDAFSHYFSQTGFRGSVPVAVGSDREGRFLAAAYASDVATTPGNWPFGYIAAARLDSPGATAQWGLPAWVAFDAVMGVTLGKPFYNDSGDQIGRLTILSDVTGGNPIGPSISAPAIDAAGNIWFLGAFVRTDAKGIEIPGSANTGLFRAVYDGTNPAAPEWCLERVFVNGQVIHGANSGRDFKIIFLSIADNDSIASNSLWANSVNQSPWAGAPDDLDPADQRNLGGLVLSASVIYDVNQDGQFISLTGAQGDPNSPDQNYSVMLMVAPFVEGGGKITDCNENGIDDAEDIAGGTSRDCFDYDFPQVPGGPYTAGGANGVPDECECVADWNRDGIANSTDVGEHINTYFLDQSTLTTIFADVDCNGVSNSADVGEFINTYFAAQANQLPFAGCTI